MADKLPIYTAKEVLNIYWIRKEDLKLDVVHEGKYYRQFWIVDKYRRQLRDVKKNELVKLLDVLLYKVDKRKIYRWYESKFNFIKIYKRTGQTFYDSLPAGGAEEFTVNLYRKDKVVGTALLSYDLIRNTEVEETAPVEPPKVIDVKKAVATREAYVRSDHRLEFNSEEDKEDLIISVCEDMATGIYTITEVCDRHKLPYLQFIEILSGSEFARRTYNEAILINNTIQSSRQLTLVDQRLIALLASGKHRTETVHQKKVRRADTMEAEWVDSRRSVTERDLTTAELLTIKMALVRSWQLGSMLSPDEFGDMTDADLMSYVKTNYTELDGRRGDTEILEQSRKNDANKK